MIVEPDRVRLWTADPFLWTLRTLAIQYDSVVSQTTRWLRYEKWRDGGLVATEMQRFRLQHWSVAEFKMLLEQAGFARVTISGDYQHDLAPEPSSSIWTFHATRH